MRKVFEESYISRIKIKNRIIRSATHEGLADEEGRPTEKLIKKLELLAKGEVGAIITGHAGVKINGKVDLHNMTMINRDDIIPYHRELTERIHKYGTSIILQISHGGRQTTKEAAGGEVVAPSAIRDKYYSSIVPHELSEKEIYEIIDCYVEGIVRAQKSGYDGVQLHMAHGYLLSSFLSPHMNRRKDKWGGNTISRFRIVKEILRKAKKRVGEYPILAKINGEEKSKHGIKIKEAVTISKYLEEEGCCGIEVSCGILEEGFYTIRGNFPKGMIIKNNPKVKKIPGVLRPLVMKVLEKKMGSPKEDSLYNLKNAETIKGAVKIPVIVVGGIRKMDDIEDIVSRGKCDYVSMSRPLVLEPNLVSKFKDGKQREAKCINCNYCVIGEQTGPLRCYYGKI